MKLDKINISEAFRYLGYGTNTPDENILAIAAECEKQLLAAIDGKYVYRYFEVEKGRNRTEPGIRLAGTDMELKGNSIAEHLDGCRGVVMFAVTLSEGVDRLIRRFSVGHMTSAVIADSMASAAVEQLCDIAERGIMAEFPGKYATWRFSPGYGDFPLESQRKLLTVLDAPKRIGVNITQGGLMAPCKSVTAVMGISDREIDRKRRGCTVCDMRERCGFRRKGGHCGF